MIVKIDTKTELVPIHMDYAKDIYEGFDKEVIQFLPIDEPPKKIAETMAFIEYSIEQVENKTDLVWVILNEGVFAGCCGIHGIPTKQPHFGLWIKRQQQGKGIGKKVVSHMLPWGISNLDVEFIKYPVDKRNQKSIHLISKLKLKLSDHYEMGNQKKLDVSEYRLYKVPPTH
ncbi:GNAT family N-acetyltransferase [Ulvibacterium sp.]|uniref:GNAT family N-acetyltransferase n=1 Tax=Ulvibacterium sp. TaxID=2665914 RepID=UPI00262F9AA2|nr:GNAT family N-acetyltransferase [Ulvibacterium sp.]